MPTKQDSRQTVLRAQSPMIGNAANEQLDVVFPRIDAEMAKLFEDRNVLLAEGGTVTVNSTATSIALSSALSIHINSQVAGGTPAIVDLTAASRAFSADGRMLYATVDRSAGTAIVTADSATLPSVVFANQEVFLIAKRVGTVIYFRNGQSFSAGQSGPLGRTGAVLDTEFKVVDATDTTKQLALDAAGTTGTSTTLLGSQTVNRTLTLPDATDTLVGKATTDVLTNKTLQFLQQAVATDSTTTGANTTLAAFTAGIVRLTNASLVSLSGIPAGLSGQSLTVENQTGNSITINNQEATATAANRIYTGSNANAPMPANATFVFTYDSTAASWMLTGGSGSGTGSGSGKNYFSTYLNNPGNGDFESGSVTGWSKVHSTLDSITKLPNQASGAWTAVSANLAFTAVTSGKLAGNYSGQIASSTASVAGDMIISNSFSIDMEDQARVLSFKFYYSLTSGAANTNFSGTNSNSFAIAFYDVTNNVWIQPTGVYNFTQNSGVGIATGSFQTTWGTSQYRLAVYFPNASSGAFNLLVDDFSFGPQSIPTGFAGTDWKPFTPTGGMTTNTIYQGWWKQKGDDILVRTKLTFSGAPNASSMTLNVPFGNIDTAKMMIPSGDQALPKLGFVQFRDQGNANYEGDVEYNSPTSVLVNKWTPSGSNVIANTANATIPFSIGSGDSVWCEYAYSAVGLSSNVQMSSDSDTRIVDFIGYVATNQALTANTTDIALSVIKDSHGLWTGSSYPIQVPGDYSIASLLQSTASISGLIYVYKNGSQVASLAYFNNSVISTGNTILENLKSGDVLSFRSATSMTTSNVNGTLARLTIQRISGPVTIAVSETISVSYYCSANVTSSSSAPINFDSKEYASHDLVTTGSGWKFTSQTNRLYTVTVSGNQTANTNYVIYKNGSAYKAIGGGGTSGNGSGSTDIRLLAGEYIDIRSSVSATFSGGSLSGSSTTNISIKSAGI